MTGDDRHPGDAAPSADLPRDAEPATRAVHAALRARLDFDDQTDFENARRGLIEAVPDGGLIKNRRGAAVWDLSSYAFLDGEAPIETVNPSLLRMARLNMANGLFQVCERVYQVRGMDLANMTIVEGATGLILIDCLTTAETAAAALALYHRHRPRRPVVALLYTHSHVDHYGGAKGVLNEADVLAGKATVVAPDGFLEAVGGENVLAGNAMTRRAQFQFGPLLKPGPRGQVDAGLGKGVARGRVTLIAPTLVIEAPVERHRIDGVDIDFHLAPGTEAPAEMHMFFPQLGVLNMAENATPLLHNFCPLRGSEVRDPRLWSYYLADAVERFGGRAEVLICQHHWPTWGRVAVVAFLECQRDLYKHIHDQTVRLDAVRATGRRWRINWTLSDRKEKVALTLSNETLTHLMDRHARDAEAHVTTTREVLVGLIVRRAQLAEVMASGALTVTGDPQVLSDLFELLDDFELQFDIVTPGAEVPGAAAPRG